TGTDLTQVNLDLASTPGSDFGDGAADSVTVEGTDRTDIIQVVGAGSSVSVLGLHAQVNITESEVANDRLTVDARGGNDFASAFRLPDGVIQLTLDGGAGNDAIAGSQGADRLLGGDGNDFILGGRGDDQVFLGAGDDAFLWNPGDGSDTVEGGDGTDAPLFNAAAHPGRVDVPAHGHA